METDEAPGGDKAYLHAGGQGFWVARMAGVEVDPVPCHRSCAVWVSTGRDGEQATIAQTDPPPLDRHEVDMSALEPALAGGVDVLKVSHEDLLSRRAGCATRRATGSSRRSPPCVPRARAVVVSRAADPAIADTGGGVLEIVSPQVERTRIRSKSARSEWSGSIPLRRRSPGARRRSNVSGGSRPRDERSPLMRLPREQGIVLDLGRAIPPSIA